MRERPGSTRFSSGTAESLRPHASGAIEVNIVWPTDAQRA
jgi:hypothetical protein